MTIESGNLGLPSTRHKVSVESMLSPSSRDSTGYTRTLARKKVSVIKLPMVKVRVSVEVLHTVYHARDMIPFLDRNQMYLINL